MQKVKTKPQILITGATGQQGGAVAKMLEKKGVSFRAMSRSSQKLKHLQDRGMEIVEGTHNDKESLKKALTGIKQAYLVTTPFEEGTEKESQHGINFVDAAVAAGVEHLVFSSVASCDKNTGIPHFDSKWKIEQHIKKTGIKATILRPVFFMDNFGSQWLFPKLKQGKLSLPLKPSISMQMISLDDIGAFAEAAFNNPSQFINQTIELAADQLTIPEALQRISKASGKSITYEEMPEAEAEAKFGSDFAKMFRWFNKGAYSVNIQELKKWGVPLTNFDGYLKKAEWINKF